MYFPFFHFYIMQSKNQYPLWKSLFSGPWTFHKKSAFGCALRRKPFGIHLIVCFCLVLNSFVFSEAILRSAFAGQGHEECDMCHRSHSAKDLALFPESIKQTIMNPHTGKQMDKIDALCMKCHASPPYGKGIRKIDPSKKHPFGIRPVLVNLPDQASGFGEQTEQLACIGCHDPHPSNQNIGYLRTPSGIQISRAEEVIKSCLWCHPNMETVFDVLPKTDSKHPKPKKKPLKPPSIGGIGF